MLLDYFNWNITNNLIKSYWDKLSDTQFSNLNFNYVRVENLLTKDLSEIRMNIIKRNIKYILQNLIKSDKDNCKIISRDYIELKNIIWLIENDCISNEVIVSYRQYKMYCDGKLIKLFTREELANPQYEDLKYMTKYQLEKANITNLNFSAFNPNDFAIKNIIEKLSNEQIQQFNLTNIEVLRVIINNEKFEVRRELVNKLSDEQINQIDISNIEVLRAAVFESIYYDTRRELVNRFSNEQINRIDISNIEILRTIIESRDLLTSAELVNRFSNEQINQIDTSNIEVLRIIIGNDRREVRKEIINRLSDEQISQINISDIEVLRIIIENSDGQVRRELVNRFSDEQIRRIDTSNIENLRTIIENSDFFIRRELVNKLSNEQISQIDISNIEILRVIIGNSDLLISEKLVNRFSDEQIRRIDTSNIEILRVIIENSEGQVRRELVNRLSDEQINQIDRNNNDVVRIILSCAEDDFAEKILGNLLNNSEYITGQIINNMAYSSEEEEYLINFRNSCGEDFSPEEREGYIRNNLGDSGRNRFAKGLSKKIIQHINFTQINDIKISEYIISIKKKYISKDQILCMLNSGNTQLIDYLVDHVCKNFDDECCAILNLNDLSSRTIFNLVYHCLDKLSDEQIHQIDISQFYNYQIDILMPIFPFQKLSREQIQRINFENLYRSNARNLVSFYIYERNYFPYLRLIIENSNENLLETQVLSLFNIICEAKNVANGLSERFRPALTNDIIKLIISLIQSSYSRYLPQNFFNSLNETEIFSLVRTSYDKLSDGQREQIEERIHFYLRDLNNLSINSAFRLILNLGRISFDEAKQFKFSYRETGCIIELLALEQEADSLFCFSDFFYDFKGNGFLKSLYNGEKNDELNESITPNILKQIVCLKARDCYGSKKGLKIVRKLRSYFSKLPQDYKNELNQINEIDLMDK